VGTISECDGVSALPTARRGHLMIRNPGRTISPLHLQTFLCFSACTQSTRKAEEVTATCAAVRTFLRSQSSYIYGNNEGHFQHGVPFGVDLGERSAGDTS
jgi:hypothetical protein